MKVSFNIFILELMILLAVSISYSTLGAFVITNNLSGGYLFVVSFALGFCMFMLVRSYGDIREIDGKISEIRRTGKILRKIRKAIDHEKLCIEKKAKKYQSSFPKKKKSKRKK